MDKLKEFRFISSHTFFFVHIIEPVEFKQENVNPSNTAKVKTELFAKADTHYCEAVAKVEAFDFGSLFVEDFVSAKVKITYTINAKEYKANIEVRKPIIWDKAWTAIVSDCPIQTINFTQGSTITRSLILKDGKSATITSATHSLSSDKAIIIKTSDCDYIFYIIAKDQIKLDSFKPTGGSMQDLADKYYILN